MLMLRVAVMLAVLAFSFEVQAQTPATGSLGFEAPRGARVVKAEPGSPVEKADLKAGDLIVALDSQDVADAKSLMAALSAEAPGAAVRLRVLRAGRERTLVATVAVPPAIKAAELAANALQPQLDTGGHRAVINGLAFTPDGRFIVSGSDDKVIRVWDWRAGKTVRTIRGEAEAGDAGKIYALALSPDGATLAVGGLVPQPGC